MAYGLVRVTQETQDHEEGVPDAALAVTDDARLFNAVGCAKCHVPTSRGVHGEVPLYSDLLLHGEIVRRARSAVGGLGSGQARLSAIAPVMDRSRAVQVNVLLTNVLRAAGDTRAQALRRNYRLRRWIEVGPSRMIARRDNSRRDHPRRLSDPEK